MFRSFPRTRESRAASAGVRGSWVPAFRLRSLSYGGLEQRTRRSLVRRRVAGTSGIENSGSIPSRRQFEVVEPKIDQHLHLPQVLAFRRSAEIAPRVGQKQRLVIHAQPDRCVDSSRCEIERIAAMRSRRNTVLPLRGSRAANVESPGQQFIPATHPGSAINRKCCANVRLKSPCSAKSRTEEARAARVYSRARQYCKCRCIFALVACEFASVIE
jgi:hypothetical protein